MIYPNFLNIGAAKSGTTSLYYYLKQHPQIYMSPLKETNFFVYENMKIDHIWWGGNPRALLRSITNIENYFEQFNEVKDEIAIGEASPLYLYHPNAPDRIKHYIPDTKLIAILRNPADRAFSHYTNLMMDNREPCLSFEEALEEENRRMQDNWTWDYFYRDMGFYYKQLKRYYKRFDTSKILIILYDDLLNNEFNLCRSIYQFLGVDENYLPDISERINVSGVPRNKFLYRFIRYPNPVKSVTKYIFPKRFRKEVRMRIQSKNLKKITINVDTRRRLLDDYRIDILKLQDLIQRDLSFWLEY